MQEDQAISALNALAHTQRLRVFRAIYSVTALSMLPRAWHAWRHRRRQARLGFDGDTLHRDAP